MNESAEAARSPIEWIAPAPDLKDFVNTLFVFTAGEGRRETMVPAISAQLFVFVRGRVSIRYPGGGGVSSDFVCNAPLLRAAPLVVEGPLSTVGVSFTPLGWAMISQLPVDEVHDRTLDVADMLSPQDLDDLGRALADLRSGKMNERALCQALEALLRKFARHSKVARLEDHRALLKAIDDWLCSSLSPAVADLYDGADLSARQVQRLCKRYFGVPPAQLVKRYRAIRAAMLLAHDDLSEDLRDHAFAAYFDQAHLIRDIRRFTGLTPRQLKVDPLARAMLDPAGHGRHGEIVLRARGGA